MGNGFCEGDIVIAIDEFDGNTDIIEKQGVIKSISDWDDDLFAVEFEEDVDKGHDCDGNCADDRGWWCKGSVLELADPTRNEDIIFEDISISFKEFI